MDDGFVKLYRALKKHWVYKDSHTLHVWIHCLIDATYVSSQRKVKGKLVSLFPGQTVFGRDEWGKELNIEPSKVYRCIQLFEQAGMITRFSVKGQYSVITISNWSAYQHMVSEQQPAQKQQQENEQPQGAENMDLTVVVEQENEQHLNSTCTHNKNVKNDKKKENTYSSSEQEILDSWNQKGIVVHSATTELQKEIKKALYRFGREKVLEAIEHYSVIHQCSKTGEYWYSHKWRLDKFLKQSNGLPDFLEDGQQWINYNNRDTKKKSGIKGGKPGNMANYEQRKYEKDYFDSLYEEV